VITVALGLVIGLSLGLLGGGGSILTVPVLVYVLGYDVKQAVAMSLVLVGLTSVIGAAIHWRLGNVRLSTAALFGAIAMVGAFAGARLAVFLTSAMQLGLLAAVMVAASVAMFRRPSPPSAMDVSRVAPRPAAYAPVAAGVGILTGLLGVGGGFLVVPALAVLARMPMRHAVGTSLVVIAMSSASGFAGYVGVVAIDWGFVAVFTAAAVGGTLGGTALMRRAPVLVLRRGFAVLLLVVGAVLASANLATLGNSHLEATPPRRFKTLTTH
jgi:uncharacterized membrane protein YfcA